MRTVKGEEDVMENTIKTRVIKRNGEEVSFDLTKIVNAIRKANQDE